MSQVVPQLCSFRYMYALFQCFKLSIISHQYFDHTWQTLLIWCCNNMIPVPVSCLLLYYAKVLTNKLFFQYIFLLNFIGIAKWVKGTKHRLIMMLCPWFRGIIRWKCPFRLVNVDQINLILSIWSFRGDSFFFLNLHLLFVILCFPLAIWTSVVCTTTS